MRAFIAAVILAVVFSSPAQAWPCWVVRAYAKGKSTAELEQYAKKMTAEQRAAALKCLHRKDRT